MPQQREKKSDFQKVTDIVRDAGGRIVGRTRLQKIGYLLEISGLGDGFSFDYHHYGPYSEELYIAVRNAALLGHLREEEHRMSWGGFYSIYTTSTPSDLASDSPRHRLARQAASADPVQLELAATAAFLATEGIVDAWGTTAKLKPEKAEHGNLRKARLLYQTLIQITTPRSLPNIL